MRENGAGLSIREAVIDDAEALQRYAARLFAERLPGIYERATPTIEEEREFLRPYVESDNSVLLLGEAGGEVVGLLGFLGRQLPQESHVGSVGVSVERDWRGRGVGTALFRELFAWAPSHGIDRIEIEAFAVNGEAIRLYERLGFEREGVRRGAVVIDGERVDVVCLARRP